jgi:hypothetical protein
MGCLLAELVGWLSAYMNRSKDRKKAGTRRLRATRRRIYIG